MELHPTQFILIFFSEDVFCLDLFFFDKQVFVIL